MPDILLTYIGFTIGMTVGWLKFLPKIIKQKSVYKILNVISLFFMIVSYFPYKNFIENIPNDLALKYIMFLTIYFVFISFVMYLIVNRFKQTDENS